MRAGDELSLTIEKPAAGGRMLARHEIAPRTAAMVEDLPRNLEPAAQLGMTTVWIKNDGAWALPPDRKADLMREFEAMGRAHHVVEDLATWVRAVAGTPQEIGRAHV